MTIRVASAAAAAVVLLAASRAGAQEEPPPPFEVYGFVQGDYVQDFLRVDPAWVATLRPTRIPTVDGTFGNNGEATVSARQSRLGVRANFDSKFGLIETMFEFDMFGVGVDEGQTTIRLRHAWGKVGQFGGGQTHSPFMDIDIFPNVIDYWGPAGMVFLRNPQLRWSPFRGDFELVFALERPFNDIDPGTRREVDPSLTAQQHPLLPDLSGHARYGGKWGHVQLAGIVRALGWEVLSPPDNEPNAREVGWGFNLTSRLNFMEKSRLLLGIVYGQGIASYMNDGGVDLGASAPGKGKTVPLLGLTAYVDLFWTKHWSTALGWSMTQVWNTDLQAGSAFESGQYASINLLWQPLDQILAGVEVLWGRREDNDGNSGNDARAQLSLKYTFSSLPNP